MTLLGNIQAKIARRLYEFSKHAVDQTIARDISVAELEQAVAHRSEVIENYPEDKYGPSCLILGFTDADRPLHVQCSHPVRPLIKIITVYQPDPALWIDLDESLLIDLDARVFQAQPAGGRTATDGDERLVEAGFCLVSPRKPDSGKHWLPAS